MQHSRLQTNLKKLKLILELFLCQYFYKYLFSYTKSLRIESAANDVVVNAHLPLHVYYVPTHTTLCLSVQAANSPVAQNALGNCADTNNLRHSLVLSSVWSVHYANAVAQVSWRFFQPNPWLY